MKTNIKFIDTKYISTSNGTIKCIMKVIIHGYPFKVTGTSHVSLTDTFDEVKGRRIAESRAKAKVYKKAYNIYLNIYYKAERCINYMTKLKDKCEFLYKNENKHIEKLCEE